MKIDDDWFPIVALGCGVIMGGLAIFASREKIQSEAIALATNLITMAGTAFGLRAKYNNRDNDY